jgi:putative transposase
LHLTVDTGIVPKNPIERLKTAGVDMGEIHIAYCTTDDGNTIGISGRQLRSIKQLRNKRFASLDEQLSKCKNGSKKHKKLSRLKRKASSKLKRQQRDILHKASRQLVDFCEENKVANIAIGDVRDISDGVDLGKKTNQKISQWAHGQFSNYVKQKAKTIGINTKLIDESYSSKTCSVCGYVKKNSVQGRNYHCKECQSKVHRDANGSANICSKARYGEYSKVQVNQIKYLKPVKIGFSRPSEARQVADKMLANAN